MIVTLLTIIISNLKLSTKHFTQNTLLNNQINIKYFLKN